MTTAGTACSLEATRNIVLTLSTSIYSFFFVTRWRREGTKWVGDKTPSFSKVTDPFDLSDFTK